MGKKPKSVGVIAGFVVGEQFFIDPLVAIDTLTADCEFKQE